MDLALNEDVRAELKEALRLLLIYDIEDTVESLLENALMFLISVMAQGLWILFAPL